MPNKSDVGRDSDIMDVSSKEETKDGCSTEVKTVAADYL